MPLVSSRTSFSSGLTHPDPAQGGVGNVIQPDLGTPALPSYFPSLLTSWPAGARHPLSQARPALGSPQLQPVWEDPGGGHGATCPSSNVGTTVPRPDDAAARARQHSHGFRSWFLGRSSEGRSGAHGSAQGRILPVLRAYSHQCSGFIPISAEWLLPTMLRDYSHQCSGLTLRSAQELLPTVLRDYSHQSSGITSAMLRGTPTNAQRLLPPVLRC